MGCQVCNINLTENDLFYCGSCEDVRRRWEGYCSDNNIYKKRREYKKPGRKRISPHNFGGRKNEI